MPGRFAYDGRCFICARNLLGRLPPFPPALRRRDRNWSPRTASCGRRAMGTSVSSSAPRDRRASLPTVCAGGDSRLAGQPVRLLDAREIVTILSLLRGIDNPLLDIPLGRAMLSELFRFTPDELAALRVDPAGRTSGRDFAGEKDPPAAVPLYLAALAAAEEDTALGRHCREFVGKLGRFRMLASHHAHPELIQRIYDEDRL